MSNIRFNLDTQYSDKIDVNLLYVTTSKYEGDWHSILHTHYFTELFYVTRGEGCFLVQDKRFAVREHDLVIVNPYVEHTEMSINASPLEYIVLGIEGLMFEFGEGNDDSFSVLSQRSDIGELPFYLHAMIRELQKKEKGYELVCQDLLEVLVIHLMRRTNSVIGISSAKRTNKECAVIKRYIDNNYKENITLDTLAQLTHMSKYYLVHAFSKYMGISPINYLIEKRVEESKNLLSSTNYSISQISDIIGFSSQSYFSQVFKREAGETPGEYRKRVKSMENRTEDVSNLEKPFL